MDRFAGTSVVESARRAVVAGRNAFGPGWSPDRFAVAPGRIELLGNHLDYNGGPVLAAAIDRFVATAVAFSHSAPENRLFAADSPDPAAEPLGDPDSPPSAPPRTGDYVRGVLA